MEIKISDLLKRQLPQKSGKNPRIISMHIHPENGKVMGMMSSEGFLPADNLYIGEDGVQFSGEVQSSLSGDNWYIFQVQNTSGKKRGKVSEIWIDAETMHVTKIESTKSFLGFLPVKKIFSFECIFRIFPRKKLIVVKEEDRIFTVRSEKSQEVQSLPAMTSAHVLPYKKSILRYAFFVWK